MTEVLNAEECIGLFPTLCHSKLKRIIGGVKLNQSRIIDTPLYLQGTARWPSLPLLCILHQQPVLDGV
jgi:hypothetical protein